VSRLFLLRFVALPQFRESNKKSDKSPCILFHKGAITAPRDNNISHYEILEDKMTSSNHVSAQDISAKWSKVTQNEAAAIRNVDSLSTQVQKSYGLDKAKADAEVKQFMGARTF
jgi:excinuclease UvrABC nuclease subunit